MSKLRSVLSSETLRTLYCTLVLPFYDYCNIVWGRASENNLNKLKLLQKRAIRICAGAHYRAHTSNLFQQLKLLPLNKLTDLKTGIFMYKYFNKSLPDLFTNFCLMQNQVHSQKTRNCLHYRLPLYKSALSQKQSVKFNGVKIWNNLSSYLKESKTLVQFKTRYKSILRSTN